jgi:hypothetical protein
MSCTNITWPSTSPSRLFFRHHFYRFALLQGSVQVADELFILFYGTSRIHVFGRHSFEMYIDICAQFLLILFRSFKITIGTSVITLLSH